MGKNKAFIQIDGIPIIRRIYTLFRTLFSEIVIVTNEIDPFQNFEAKICSDLIPGQGVLGGLYTGIYYATFEHTFCVACDMPFLKASLIRFLMERIESYDVVIPRTEDGLQPLHAFYSRNCLDPIRNILERRQFKITDFFPMVKLRIVDEKEFFSLDPLRESFLNVNTPEELGSLERPTRVLER